ncbi:uncharacterized protein LOC103311649 [Acyrthosiphon pisum]|uniref:DUF7041 domain-containing protein n=1 Tax=Acyrthosiphon pisum TaxID=7029 RepID=A0A8R2FEX2_ACYPI|nr:uncharacterized protein LOC103311649 [Acyrthosiphon pisum]|eukprot:XP_008189553.1 PREDICTED: uncharacterized protein LOC103311649 [Acyrthosiphon pisum]
MDAQNNAPNDPNVVVNANQVVDAIANMRLPAFWKRSPTLWFNYAESTFITHRVTANATKVHFVVSALDEEAVRNIGDLLNTAASYSDIRTRLISAYEVPQALLFREIVKPGGLGDRRPSQLLRDMRNSMPPSLGEDALKEFWLQKLPSSVTAILVGLDAPLDELAARADRILDVSNPQSVDVLSKEQFSDMASAVSALSQQVKSLTKIVNSAEGTSRSRSRAPARSDAEQPEKMCFYHARFGKRARACHSPCSFKQEPRESPTSTPAEN